MPNELAPIFDALADILKEERQATNTDIQQARKDASSQVNGLREDINRLDGNALIKTAAVAIADANLAALREHAENVLLRKPSHINGTLPAICKGIGK